MGDFTPTTEQVRFAYIDHRDFDSQVGLSEWPGDDEVGWEFDRWLATVKAEAWGEAVEVLDQLHGDLPGLDHIVQDLGDINPYRTKETP